MPKDKNREATEKTPNPYTYLYNVLMGHRCIELLSRGSVSDCRGCTLDRPDWRLVAVLGEFSELELRSFSMLARSVPVLCNFTISTLVAMSSSGYGPVQSGRPPGGSASDGLLDNGASSSVAAVSSSLESVDLDFNTPYACLVSE